jgi:hypothetical protein
MSDKDKIRILRRAVKDAADYLDGVNGLLDGDTCFEDNWKTNTESCVGGKYRMLKEVLKITRKPAVKPAKPKAK